MHAKTLIKKLQIAQKQLAKCGGDCRHCPKCHIYTVDTPRTLYMAVGCDLLPDDHFTSIADVPSQLHREAVETVEFELGGIQKC